jgi:Flp pilus assembly protein TadG
MIEFAIIAPLLFLLIVGMVDVGLVVFGNSVGSNAAREGARVGIVNYKDADVVGSDDNDAIRDAVLAKLGTTLIGTPTIGARCLTGGTNAVKVCSNARVDFDLIEVTVTWQHVGITPFVSDSTHTDISRLVIVGEINIDDDGPAPPLQFTVDSPTVVEGEPGEQPALEFTVSRSHNAAAASVTYTATSGTATVGVDFVATTGSLSFTAGGALTATAQVLVNGDDAIEGDETLTLVLSNPSPSGSQVNNGTGTITNDDFDTTPPVLLSVEIRDGDGDGKLDFLVATFDEPLGCTGSWTFSDASGGSVQTSAVNGSLVQVFLNEGAGFNTGPTVTVSSNQACDLAGNQAGVQSGPIIDRAAPRVVGLSSPVKGSIVGRAQTSDTIQFVLSEAVTGVPGTPAVTISDPSTTANDNYAVAGISSSSSLGRNDYITTNNRTATFTSTVTVAGTNVTVRLGTCSGNGCASTSAAAGTATNTGSVVVTPASTLRDAANNAAGGTFTITTRLF